MQPARRVHQHTVRAAGDRCLDRVVGDRAGITSRLMRDELTLCAVGPDPHLVDGGGAIRVGGRDDRCSAFLSQSIRHLSHGGRLAATVDSHDEHHARERIEVQRAITLLQHRQHLCMQRGHRGAGIADVLSPSALAQCRNEALRRRHAAVGGD